MQQKNKSPMDQGNCSQSFDVKYPYSFEEFKNSRIGNVRIAEIPSRIKENQLKIWGRINVDMNYLTTPLADSIKVASMLYILRPYLYAQQGGLQEKVDMHHAFIRLKDIWTRLDDVLESWAKTEIGTYANAADGLSCLEQARFLPRLHRFYEATQGDGEQSDLFEEAEEFVTTSIMLTQQIEVWLASQNAW